MKNCPEWYIMTPRRDATTYCYQGTTVSFASCISLLNMKPHINDSYHPRAKGDHSKDCTLIGDGSTPTSPTSRIFCKVSGDGESPASSCRGKRAVSCWISVSTV